jgi:hypothetical protein
LDEPGVFAYFSTYSEGEKKTIIEGISAAKTELNYMIWSMI